MGLGLNDDINDGLVNDNPNTPMGVDPNKIEHNDANKSQEPIIKIGKLDKIISYTEPEKDYTPPTKEQLFGQEIVENKLPNFDIKVSVKDEVTKLNDLRYGQTSIYKKGSISQEDIKALDSVYKGALINDDNPLGFYTKHASKTQYTQTLKQVNDLINKKVFILNENYQKYLQTLKESAVSFKQTFGVNANIIKGYISMVSTEKTQIVEPFLTNTSENSDTSNLKSLLTQYLTEVDAKTITSDTQILNMFGTLKDSFLGQAKFFKAFIDLHFKKDITTINASDIRAKLYHEDTRYSVLDLMDFVINQLPFLQPVVERTIDKDLINIDTILNNYLNAGTLPNQKIDIINKNQVVLDEIEQELFVFDQIVKESVYVCKNISLLITAIESKKPSNDADHQDIEAIDVVSQEGFIDRIGHAIKKIFTSTNSIIEDLSQIDSWVVGRIQKYDPIEEPGWGRVFNSSGKKYLMYADVDKVINGLYRLVVDTKFEKAIEDCVDIIDTVTLALNKGNLFSDDQSTFEIVNQVERSNELAKHFADILQNPQTVSYDPDFKPLIPKEAIKLADDMVKILSYSKTDNKVNNLLNSIDAYEKAINKNKKLRADKKDAGDIRAAEMVLHKLKPTTDMIYDIYKTRKAMAYSLKEYIHKSFR